MFATLAQLSDKDTPSRFETGENAKILHTVSPTSHQTLCGSLKLNLCA